MIENIRNRIQCEINGLLDKNNEKNNFYKYNCLQLLGTRENQQDSYAVLEKEDEFLAILGDGIGGMQYGEISSIIGVYEVIKAYQNSNKNISFLLEGFQNADDSIREVKRKYQLTGSGSTLLAVYIKHNKLYMCSVGDSYLYLYRKNKLKRINISLNYEYFLNQLLKENKITIDDYKMNLDKKKMLISFIGKGKLDIIDFTKEAIILEKEDVILISSDGLFDAIEEAELKKILEKNGNPETVNRTLENLIKIYKKKHQDNTTVITIQKITE